MGCSAAALLPVAVYGGEASPALALDASPFGTENPLVSAGFVVAVALLLVVTGGVAYLSVSDFNDRQEEKKAAELASKEAKFASKDAAAERKLDLPAGSKPKRATSKGFGSK